MEKFNDLYQEAVRVLTELNLIRVVEAAVQVVVNAQDKSVTWIDASGERVVMRIAN